MSELWEPRGRKNYYPSFNALEELSPYNSDQKRHAPKNPYFLWKKSCSVYFSGLVVFKDLKEVSFLGEKRVVYVGLNLEELGIFLLNWAVILPFFSWKGNLTRFYGWKHPWIILIGHN